MAAKKTPTKRKSPSASKTVTLQLDEDSLRALQSALETISQVAAAVMTATDNAAAPGPSKRGARKSAKKRARKTS
jgi:hypothetical protein